MEDAQSQRGPPPPADERSASSRAPREGSQREHWQREDSSHPWRSRASLEEDRFASKKPWSNGSGNGAGPSSFSSASATATGEHSWQTGDTDWERTSGAPRRERLRDQERSYGRPAGPPGAGSSAAAAGGSTERSSNGPPPYRRHAHAQRTRSQSPPGSSTSSSTLPYSSAPPRQRYEQQSSPPKRPWQSRDSRESMPPSSSYTDTPPPWDRGGPQRGARGGPWGDRRPNGVVGSHSTPYHNDRFASRSARDGRIHFEEPVDRRPLDNSWSRQPKPHGYASSTTALTPARLTAPHSSDVNGWRDDKGKGPAYEYDGRRPSFSRNNQNNPPSSLSESRGRSPESVRSRERRSPSYDDFPIRSPASSTHSHSRLSDRIPPEYERQRIFPQPRLSAPPKQSHPPLNRSSSAGQPAHKRDFDFPPDRPPDVAEARAGRSASVSQGYTPQNGNRSWPVRRRSLSASPPREAEEAKDQSSPRSLAERLGPLATVAKELQDRIEPIIFRARTPPLKSPIRQSAPSTLQRNRSPLPQPSTAIPPPVIRSFTPPLPSPARRPPQPPNGIESIHNPPKDTSPSPKLGSSPSDAANSSPRPSTTDLEFASSEFTQGRTSPDVSKDDDSMQEEERPDDETRPMLDNGTDVSRTQPLTSLDRMPRAPVPLRSHEAVAVGISPADQDQDSTAKSRAGERLLSTRTQASGEEEQPPVNFETVQSGNLTEKLVIVAKVETVEAEMTLEDSTSLANTASTVEVAETSASSIVVKEVEMDTDEPETLVQTAREDSQEEEEHENEETSLLEEEAKEEDPRAREFAKSLLSFIETNEPDEEDASVDLSTILEDNKLKAPISLPLAVNMPEDGQDLFEIKPILLSNHDLLDGWLQDNIAARDKRRGEKIFRLRQRYKELDAEWHIHCHKLEKLRERQKIRQNMPIAPPTPSVDSAGISVVPTTPNLLAPSGRSNRRSAASSIGYGDAVRSEAEFLEILASLEDADMRDPNLRAMRTTATVPDQIIDESEYTLQQYDDNNGLVTDPFDHYTINKSPDSWTEEEIAIFCRRYALYPKQFGKIAAALPDKSTNQCVLFYYRSKKKIDFRALVDRKNRDGRRKRAKGEKGEGLGANGKKGPSLLNNIERARGGELEDDEDDEPQTPGSAMAQESTVLSTARALTQQINGTTAGRSETGKRPPAGRAASNKKAARFMSPSAERSGTDDGVPPSDGVLAAAEALGFLSNIPTGDPDDPNSRPNSARQKKRKPSMSENIMNTSFGEDGTPRAINAAKRSRPHSSSYWSVADKNEFMRLLSIHGKNYVAISKGIQSKTAVQCKNFFQNNTKKMGLAEIASRAEGEFANISGEIGPDSPMGGMEMPSVFGEPDGMNLQEPPSGYFIPSHRGNSREAEEHKPSARSGGMHLRDLLDDAPDAEGGAHSQAADEVRMQGDDDSATEDEAEPARYAQESVDARGALRQAHAERAAAQQRHASRAVKEEMMVAESVNPRGHPGEDAYYPPHMRSASFGSRSDYPEAGQYSPTYHPGHHNERGYTMPPRSMYSNTANGHYEPALPQNGHWSPYEGRSIYGPPAGSGYFQRPRHEEQVPPSYYRHEQHHPAYLDSSVHDKSTHRTAYPPRPQHNSPFYNGGGQSPPQHSNQHPRRPSDHRGPNTDATHYERYGASRAPQ